MNAVSSIRDGRKLESCRASHGDFVHLQVTGRVSGIGPGDVLLQVGHAIAVEIAGAVTRERAKVGHFPPVRHAIAVAIHKHHQRGVGAGHARRLVDDIGNGDPVSAGISQLYIRDGQRRLADSIIRQSPDREAVGRESPLETDGRGAGNDRIERHRVAHQCHLSLRRLDDRRHHQHGQRGRREAGNRAQTVGDDHGVTPGIGWRHIGDGQRGIGGADNDITVQEPLISNRQIAAGINGESDIGLAGGGIHHGLVLRRIRDVDRHKDGEKDVRALRRTGGIDDRHVIDALVGSLNVGKQQSGISGPHDVRSIETPLIGQRRRSGGAHAQHGVEEGDHGLARRLCGDRRGRPAWVGAAAARGGREPVNGIVAIFGGALPLQRGAGAIGQRRPGRGVAVVNLIDQDVGNAIGRRHIRLEKPHAVAPIIQFATIGAENHCVDGQSIPGLEGGKEGGIGGVKTHHQQIIAGREREVGREIEAHPVLNRTEPPLMLYSSKNSSARSSALPGKSGG